MVETISSEKYIIKSKTGEYAKSITWYGVVNPSIKFGTYDEAKLFTKDFLNRLLQSSDKTVEEMLLIKFPGINIINLDV